MLVSFKEGRLERPYVLGAIYTGDASPPESKPEVRTLQSKSGHKIVLDDSSGQESVRIEDQGGSFVQLDAQGVTIESPGEVTIKGRTVKLEADTQLTAIGRPIHLNP